MRGGGGLERHSGFWLVTPHRTARPIVPRPCGSPSSPAPAAHRCAATGLDRDTPGREFCIGAVNDAIGSSSWWISGHLGGCQEAKQLAAGCVEGALLGFGFSMGE